MLPHIITMWAHPVGGYASDREAGRQRAVGNEVIVKVGFRHAGRTRIIGGDETGRGLFHAVGKDAQRVADHHSGKYVGADDRIEFAVEQVFFQLACSAPEQAAEGSSFPERGGVRFAEAVDLAEHRGGVAVDPDVTAGEQGGKSAKDEAECVARDAFASAGSQFVRNGAGAGVMPAADAATQNQRSHSCTSCSSRSSRSPTSGADSRAATHFARRISRGRL